MGGLNSNTKLLLQAGNYDDDTLVPDGTKEVIDSSVYDETRLMNPLTATTVGGATLGTPKFGSHSLALDGTGDYLTVSDSTAWNFGSGDFTIDAWVKFSDTATGDQAICSQQADTGNRWYFYLDSLNNLKFHANYDGSTLDFSDSWTDRIADRWYHVAVVRDGTAMAMYIDGVQSATTGAITFGDFSADLWIGNWNHSGTYLFYGNIDELRISKGVARWTAGFEVPTSPHNSDSNDVLLMHFDSTPFTSGISHEGHVVTQGGNATLINNDSKFGGTSAYFNGSAYMTVANHADFSAIGTSSTDNWTIEWFTRFDDPPAAGTTYFLSNDATTDGFSMAYTGGSGIKYKTYEATNGGNQVNMSNAGPITDTKWHHYAFVKVGNDYAFYLDGSQISYIQSNLTISSATGPLYIGTAGSSTASELAASFMDELRIVNGNPLGVTVSSTGDPGGAWMDSTGTGGTITVPTAAYTSDSSTHLLLHFDATQSGGSLYDSGDTEHTVSNQSGSAAEFHGVYGSACASFDGTGDAMIVSNTATANPDMHIMADYQSNYTVEAWVNCSDTIGSILSHNDVTGGFYWFLDYNSGGERLYLGYTGATNVQTDRALTLSDKAWHHICGVKIGDTTQAYCAIYVDGLIGKALTHSAGTRQMSGDLYIGQNGTADTNYIDGYIDEIRINKSNAYDVVIPYAHYHCEDNAASTTVKDSGYGANDASTNGTVTSTVSTTNAAVGTRAFDLNDVSGHIIGMHSLAASVSADSVGTTSFWFMADNIGDAYLGGFSTSSGTANMWFEWRIASSVYPTVNIYSASSGTTQWQIQCSNSYGGYGTWNHLCIVHDGSTPAVWHNGVLTTAMTISTNPSAYLSYHSPGADEAWLGTRPTYNAPSVVWNGKFDDFRYYRTALNSTQVQALYNKVDFTVPTEPHTADANTKLLLHFDTQDNSFEGRNA